MWKSNGVSFNQAIGELKVFFKVVDKIVSDKHFESFVKNEYIPEKFLSPLN